MSKLSAALVCAAAAGCAAEQPVELSRDRVLIGPIPAKHQVVWADSALDQVVAVEVAGRPTVARWPIGRRPVYAVPAPGGERLLVVTRGEEALARGQVDEDPILWDVDLAAPDRTPTAYPVGSPFDRIAVSTDGSIAIAYFSAAGPDGEGYFRNPNELAFVDLARPPGPDNPVIKTIRSFGAAPSGIVLSPAMAIPGAADASARTFAFVLARDVITIVDATHPIRDEVSIRLDAAGPNVEPTEVVFAPNTATAYVRSIGARDVLEVTLHDDPPPDDAPTRNDYHPVLAELGAGGGPSDIAVFDDPTGRRYVLAATPATREVVVIDADTAQFRRVPTPAPVDRIVLFPVAAAPAHRAILADIGAAAVYALDLDQVADPLVRLDVATIAVASPVRDVVPVPGKDLALLVHDDARTVLGLLDVAIGAVAPLQGIGRLDSYAFTATGEFLAGTTIGVPRLGLLDLANLHPTDLRLDHAPEKVLALPSGALVVDHADPFGRITIVPDTAATRADATVLSGFLLADILEGD